MAPGAGAVKPGAAEAVIAGDPELKALRDDTELLADENGIEVPATPDNQNIDLE